MIFTNYSWHMLDLWNCSFLRILCLLRTICGIPPIPDNQCFILLYLTHPFYKNPTNKNNHAMFIIVHLVSFSQCNILVLPCCGKLWALLFIAK